MKPGEYKIVAQRLYDILRNAPKQSKAKPALAPPAVDISGAWDVEIQYQVGSARHKLFLTAKENRVTGSHSGWAFQGDLSGRMDGDKVELRSSLPAEGTRLAYLFQGTAARDTMSGAVNLGEYGSARWSARRQSI